MRTHSAPILRRIKELAFGHARRILICSTVLFSWASLLVKYSFLANFTRVGIPKERDMMANEISIQNVG
jgi:hypothetical protein